MSLVPTFRPRIQMLSKEMIDRIIDEAFDVLATIGLQFEHPGEEYDKDFLCSDCHTGGP